MGLDIVRQKLKNSATSPQSTTTPQPQVSSPRRFTQNQNYAHTNPLDGAKEVSGSMRFTSSEGVSSFEFSPSFGYFITKNLEISADFGFTFADDDAGNSASLTSGLR